MTRSVVVRAITVVAVAAFICLAGARDAAADDPRARPCQPVIEAAVRVALPTALPNTDPAKGVRCPVTEPEYQIVNGQSVPTVAATVQAEAVLSDGRVVALEVSREGKVLGVRYHHSDLSSSSGKGAALLFWAFALAAVVGALFVVTRRNLIAAVMGMVGSFLGIAAIYMLLYAQFLAVIQMLVYAGAIMVLFVFVVMILNRPEDEPVAPSGRAGQALGGLAILYLVGKLIIMLARVEPANREVAMNAPPPVAAQCAEWKRLDSGGLDCTRSERADWGSVKAVGTDLFGPGLFPFEAISILLLVAVVGAIAIARPQRQVTGDDDDNDARPEGGTA